MLGYKNKNYEETARIKKGLKALESPFKELQNWFMEHFGMMPINIIYDVLPHNKQPRLNLVWEINPEAKKTNINWKDNKDLIEDEFRSLAVDYPDYSTENLFIISSSFSYAALVEANAKVSELEIMDLMARIGSLTEYELWQIRKREASAVFFFYTEEQAAKYRSRKYIQLFSNAYWELVRKHDEYGYSSHIVLNALVDSKYIYENKYKGNWAGYLRDH